MEASKRNTRGSIMAALNRKMLNMGERVGTSVQPEAKVLDKDPCLWILKVIIFILSPGPHLKSVVMRRMTMTVLQRGTPPSQRDRIEVRVAQAICPRVVREVLLAPVTDLPPWIELEKQTLG